MPGPGNTNPSIYVSRWVNAARFVFDPSAQADGMTLLTRDCRRGRIAITRAHDQVWISHTNLDRSLRVVARVFISLLAVAIFHITLVGDGVQRGGYRPQIVGLVESPTRLVRQPAQI